MIFVNRRRASPPTKVVRDGQVLIQRGDRIYDLRGQEVR